MIKIELEEKTLLGLVVGTVEERMNFFSNKNVIASLDMSTIKKIYQYKIDEVDDNNYVTIITLLQGLAYNRHKSKYKDEIGTFVLDKLFELITTGEIC